MSERMQAALVRPNVDNALDRFTDALLEDPLLASEGEAAWEAVTSSRELSTYADALQEKLGELPEMQALVERLMQRNPDASPDRIGELAGEHIGAVMDSAEYDQAFERAIDRLFERPKVAAAFARLEADVVGNAQLNQNLTSALLAQLDDERVERRLTEVNGGKVPDRSRATELLFEYALANARLDRLQVDWLALPAARELSRALLIELLRAPSFRAHLRRFCMALIADASFQEGLMLSFGALLEEPRNLPKALAACDRLIDSGHAEQATADFLLAVIDDSALQTIANRAIDHFTSEPSFLELFQRFATEW